MNQSRGCSINAHENPFSQGGRDYEMFIKLILLPTRSTMEERTEYFRTYWKAHPGLHAQHQHAYRKRHPERRGIDRQKWRAKNPEKDRAHLLVYKAIRVGKLFRPATCSQCPNGERIEGHHASGYDRPLDVVWLCQKCHRAIHKDGQVGDYEIG